MASMMVSLMSNCVGSTVLLHSQPSQSISLSRPRHGKTEEGRSSPAKDKRKSRAPHTGTRDTLASGRSYLRRTMAYVRTPEPSSNAAAGRSIAGPPLGASGFCFPPAMDLPPFCRSEEHTSELQSRGHLVCRLLLDKK